MKNGLNIFNGIIAIGCLMACIDSLYNKDKKMAICNGIICVLNVIAALVL